jgi:phage terminase large subunit
VILNKRSGSEIIFKGLKISSGDNTASLKSLQGITTWILDEAEELVDENVFDKINLSLRTKGKQNRIILILNPATKEHWIYKRFFQQAGVEETFNGIKGDVTYIHTTYKDNIKWLSKAEGVVFTNWKYGQFNPDGLQVTYGQDYGFSIDPTTLVGVAIDKKRKIIYVKEHLYKPKLTTTQIAYINLEVCGKSLIVADGAEPRLINELHRLGCNIHPAIKGQGSISLGIALLQDYQIIVDNDSVNIGKEFNNYVYADKGSKLFVDNFNHAIDSIRYNVTYQLGKSTGIEIR